MQRLFVVYRDFFTGIDIAPRKEKNVPIQILHEGVRFAAMIDVMGSITTAAPVQTEAAVNVADAQHGPSPGAPSCFPVVDALAGVFGNLPSAREQFRGKAAFAVDWGFLDGQTRSEFQPHQSVHLFETSL